MRHLIALGLALGCQSRRVDPPRPSDAIVRAPDAAVVPDAAERDDDLVDLATAIPDAVLDIRYATADNITGAPLYAVARCKLRRGVLARVVVAANALRGQGRRLLVWDCYRPRSVQVELWKRMPDPRYVADPKDGSRHNHGAAIDLGLVAADGSAVVLPTKFDDFSEAAHRAKALAGDRGAEARRLEAAMTAAGFIGLPTEWWHFDAPDATRYPMSDDPL